jgi:hypothetical protein
MGGQLSDDYFRRQIFGLMVILEQDSKKPGKSHMISVNYVIEKIRLILDYKGINFHPEIANAIKIQNKPVIQVCHDCHQVRETVNLLSDYKTKQVKP